jgi:hypothetical protein
MTRWWQRRFGRTRNPAYFEQKRAFRFYDLEAFFIGGLPETCLETIKISAKKDNF